MSVQLNFNARTVEPNRGFAAIPSGWYPLIIDEVSSELKPSKNNPNNAYLPVRFSVLDGSYKGSKIFVRLNLVNESEIAVTIARGELSAICHATGKLDLTVSDELMGLTLFGKVKKRTGHKNEATGDDYDDSNELKAYKPISDAGALAEYQKAMAAPVATVIPPVTAPAAVAVVVPPVVAAPARDPSYTYSDDGTHRWKAGMAAWEPIPAAAPPPPPASPPPPPGGAPAQPWMTASAPAAGPVAAAGAPPPPSAPPPPPAITGASPPWAKVG